jgi:hypothetical protein
VIALKLRGLVLCLKQLEYDARIKAKTCSLVDKELCGAFEVGLSICEACVCCGKNMPLFHTHIESPAHITR